MQQIGPQRDEVALGLGSEAGPEIGQLWAGHGWPPAIVKQLGMPPC